MRTTMKPIPNQNRRKRAKGKEKGKAESLYLKNGPGKKPRKFLKSPMSLLPTRLRYLHVLLWTAPIYPVGLARVDEPGC
jgi:hypothetical protein